MSKEENKDHKIILNFIQDKADKEKPSFNQTKSNYGGYNDPEYGLSKPEKRKIVKKWKEKRKDISVKELVDLIDSLITGNSDDEKIIAGIILENFSELRKKTESKKIEEWLSYLEGWKQIDSFCQSTYKYSELLENWEKWRETIIDLSLSQNENKRRASAVLLIKPIREAKDSKLINLTEEVLNNIENSEDKLVSKAASWLLREMKKNLEKR